MPSNISIPVKLLFGLVLTLLETFANTCVTDCPNEEEFYDVTIDDESSDIYLSIQTSNCPPYASDRQKTGNSPCYFPKWWYVPKVPQFLETPDYIDLSNRLAGPIGVLLNGVLLYGPFDDYGRDAMIIELSLMDDCMSITDGDGIHYTRGLFAYYNGLVNTYSLSRCGLPDEGNETEHSPAFGWLWDGYEIYGRYNGRYEYIELDDCGGHEHPVVPYGESVEKSVYHYHMRQDSPYSIRCYSGCAERRNNPGIERTCTFEPKLRPTLMPTLSPSIIPTPAPTKEEVEVKLPFGLTMDLLLIIASAIVCACALCSMLIYLIRRRRRRIRGYYRQTTGREWSPQPSWEQTNPPPAQRQQAWEQPTFRQKWPQTQQPPFPQKWPQTQQPSVQATAQQPSFQATPQMTNRAQYSQPRMRQQLPGEPGGIANAQPQPMRVSPFTQIVAPPCPFRR